MIYGTIHPDTFSYPILTSFSIRHAVGNKDFRRHSRRSRCSRVGCNHLLACGRQRLPSTHISAHLRAGARFDRGLQFERDGLSVSGEDRFSPTKDNRLNCEQQLIDKIGGE